MKRILSIISVFAFLLTSCTGTDGRDGLNGAIIASSSFEKIITFSPSNNYQDIESYGFQVLTSDVTLVYILWETDNGQDVWRLIPQTVQFDDGNLVYNYDFTQTDVRIFLEGSTDFSFLDVSYTQDQIFRVVVVPADNVGRGGDFKSVDYTNLEDVMEFYNISEFPRR